MRIASSCVGLGLAAGVLLGNLPTALGADAPTVRYEGRDERRDRLDAMQGQPFDSANWGFLTDWRNADGQSVPALDAASTTGKVVIFVTWSSGYKTSHEALKYAQKIHEKLADKGVLVVGVHGKVGYDKAADVMKSFGAGFAMCLDQDDQLRGKLEVDTDPDLYVIDRAGRLRYADIVTSSLMDVAQQLSDETPEEAAKAPAPTSKPPEKAAEPGKKTQSVAGKLGSTKTLKGVEFTKPSADAYAKAKWPEHNRSDLSADNFQGKPLPGQMGNEQWLTAEPDMAGKVVVIDFWATWCPPCRKAMPILDRIYDDVKDDAVIVGISDEPAGKLKGFLGQNKHKYPQASDPASTLNNALRVQGIPHVVIISTDGVIRWQGNPLESDLKEKIMAVIKADPGVAARKAAEKK